MVSERQHHTSTGEAVWTLREVTLLGMLRRCYEGETPDEVYMESYVNLFDHDA